MKKIGWLWVLIIISTASAICGLINIFITPLPDWFIRTSGIMQILVLPVIVFNIVRIQTERKNPNK